MDRIWFESTPIPLQSRDDLNPDPNFAADARLLYDNEWLYVFVNVLHDNEVYIDGTAQHKLDRVELNFQNTWGGRKDGTYDHCNEENWWWYYWEQDGDRKWLMTANKSFPLQWFDPDANNACELPHACEEKEMADWLTLEVLKQVKYAVDTARLMDGTWRISYEMAFHLDNFLKYDENTPADSGHYFGLEISVRDMDSGYLNGHFNMNYPHNMAWCTPLAATKMMFGGDLNIGCSETIIEDSLKFLVIDTFTLQSIPGASILFMGETEITNSEGLATIHASCTSYYGFMCPLPACAIAGYYYASHPEYNDVNELLLWLSDTVKVYMNKSTSVENILSGNQIKIYPNPATSQIHVNTPGLTDFTLNIKKINGKTILTKHCNQEQNILNMEGIPKGIYLLQISNENMIETKKIIIQ